MIECYYPVALSAFVGKDSGVHVYPGAMPENVLEYVESNAPGGAPRDSLPPDNRLFRFTLTRLSAQVHHLRLTFSHLIFDGVCYGIFCRLLGRLYGQRYTHLPDTLPESPPATLDTGSAIEFWSQRLSCYPLGQALPFLKPQPRTLVASTCEELIAGLDACLAVPADQLDAQHSRLEGLTDPVLVARLQSWLAGANVPVFGPGQAIGSARVRLPGYPFDRKPYWAGGELEAAPVQVLKCDLPQGDTLQRLRGGLAQLLGFDETDIDTQRSLQDYGVDSISLIQLLARFGPKASQMQPHDVFDLPSIAALAQVLQEGAPTSPVDAQVHGNVGLSMHWSQIGQGRGIVLLPPLNMSALAWMQQVNVLTRQGFALHIPSYPGHESSSFEEQGFGLEALVSGIQAYLHQQFAGKAVPVVGWSLGGCLALALAARAPALVESMVLISTAARFGEDIFGKTIELNAELQTHADYLDILLEPRQTLAEQIGAGASMHTLSRYYQLLGQFDVSTGLSGIDVRTLIVHGEQDVVIADTDVQLLQRLPNARLEVVRDHGHFIPLTAARRFNGLLLDFIR
ncbi:Putative aminoacrylate hydrolase RutD [Pseudomonas fluorescens]|nr:Putative aminoacrylate hydrolase RutD [Pseudomonas fluorescens]